MQHKDTFFRASDRSNLVNEAISGFCFSCKFQNLEYYSGDGINIVKRKDWDPEKTDKVAILSGGGSGHDGAHHGYVGKNMLTACICGDVFASPSVSAVLKAIELTTNKEIGCLLIVKNYTGDRLNFGLAAEKARTMGYKNVKMLIVSDDVALDTDKKFARGIAGTVFIHKIAGWLAENKYTLEEINKLLIGVENTIRTVGASLTECANLNSKPEDIDLTKFGRIGYGKCELGLGIHGEPGHAVIDATSTEFIVQKVLEKLSAFENAHKNEKYAILLNNLGGTSNIEMSLIMNTLKNKFTDFSSRCKILVGPACLMTAIDMKGFSITLMPININNDLSMEKFIEILSSETETETWPGVSIINENSDNFIKKLNSSTKADNIEIVEGNKKEKIRIAPKPFMFLKHVAERLIRYENMLNEMDQSTGDGDTGRTFAIASRALKEMLETNFDPAWQSNVSDPKISDEEKIQGLAKLFSMIGETLSNVMGGSSGILMAIFFTTASSFIVSDGYEVALLKGLEKMKEYGGAKVGDCTMIDALEPTLIELSKQTGRKNLFNLAEVARKGAETTINMKKARAGRAAYISDRSGNMDPGAKVVEIVFAEILNITLV